MRERKDLRMSINPLVISSLTAKYRSPRQVLYLGYFRALCSCGKTERDKKSLTEKGIDILSGYMLHSKRFHYRVSEEKIILMISPRDMQEYKCINLYIYIGIYAKMVSIKAT